MAIYDSSGTILTSAYDVNGLELDVAYDVNGTEIYSKEGGGGDDPTPVDKYARILNWSISAGGWAENADSQYAAWKSVLQDAGNNAIPVFISTDPHGGGAMSEHRWFHNYNVTDQLEAININLGDICTDTYQPTTLSNMDAQTKWVRNFFAVPGNHDVKYGNVEPTAMTLRPYFARANCFEYVPSTYDTSASYVVYDDIHNIKWVAMDAYNRVGEGYTMPHPFIAEETMDWLIDVLSENDGYDIIFITHEPFQGAVYNKYSLSDPPNVIQSGTSSYSQSECVWTLLKERKNKRSGIITDDEGVSHSYDFTGCTKDLIVSLQGHTHALRYVKEDNMPTISFSRFYLVNLVIIDRDDSLLRLFMTNYTGNFNEVDFVL